MRLHSILFLLCLLAMPEICYAASGDPEIVSRIVDTFYQKSGQFTSIAKKYALQLFGLCATLEIAYLGIRAALGQSEIGETVKNFCISLLAAGLFLAIINNYETWTAQIINGLKSVAGEMGNLEDAVDRPFKKGLELVSYIWQEIKGKSFWSEGGLILAMLFSLFIVLFCFCLLTAQVIFIKCEAYVAMAAACILVGLGGTSFFRDYAINVCKYVVSVAFKLMTMQLLIGIGFTFIEEVTRGEADLSSCVVIVGVSIVLLSLVKTMPDTIGGIITGSHIGNGGGLLQTARGVGASALGGAALGAAVGTNVGLAARASIAQHGGLKEAMTGDGNILGGTVANLYRGWRQSRADTATRQNTIGSKLRDMVAQNTQPK